MATDPICGMDVQEKGAKHIIDLGQKTIYFCSGQCKEAFAHNTKTHAKPKKKGFFSKFLEKLAKDNEETFGGNPPSCH